MSRARAGTEAGTAAAAGAGAGAPALMILGCRGVPAAHGGFETFAQHLALDLVRRGWDVAVYCQVTGDRSDDGTRVGRTRLVREDVWQGVARRLVSSPSGSLGSLLFDLVAVIDALRRPGTLLVLGYNTAVLLALPRLFGRRVIVNMDGLEWARRKWGPLARLWLWINEAAAVRLAGGLIADHPCIAERLRTLAPRAQISTIVYGAPGDPVAAPPEPDRPDTSAGKTSAGKTSAGETSPGETSPGEIFAADLAAHVLPDLTPDGYFLVVCRIEPDNSVLEIVRAFRARPRRFPLVVVGSCGLSGYGGKVRAAARRGPAPPAAGVIFLGALHEPARLGALRTHARAYCHGHRVGGTNPSLVEALAAGNAVLAHDNRFNRWTAGEGQFFFRDEAGCAVWFDRLSRDDAPLGPARHAARRRHAEAFDLQGMLDTYAALLAGPFGHGAETALSLSAGTGGTPFGRGRRSRAKI